MIFWTRQIKEVLNAQDALETSESSGPLEEIEFWNNRCQDLSGMFTFKTRIIFIMHFDLICIYLYAFIVKFLIIECKILVILLLIFVCFMLLKK